MVVMGHQSSGVYTRHSVCKVCRNPTVVCSDTTLPVTLLEVGAVLYLTCQLTYMLIVCSGRVVDVHVDLYHINASAVRAQV